MFSLEQKNLFLYIYHPSVWLKKPIGRFRIEEERETSLSANRDCFLAQERTEKEKAREIEKDRKSRRQRRASVQIEIVH